VHVKNTKSRVVWKIERTKRNLYGLELDDLIIGAVITILLYVISLENHLLFHTLAELFNVLIAYIVFLVVWKSKNSLLNKYLLLIGISYFFIGSFDLLHTLAFRELGLFPGFDSDPPVQFWIVGRYLESISFLIASLFLIESRKNERGNSIFFENSLFARKTFFIYALISAYLLTSVLYLKNFPASYIEGSGVTSFKLISEHVVTLILFSSLVLLYVKRNRFDREVFTLIAISILLAIFEGLPFVSFNHMDSFPSFAGHLFKVLSYYFIYRAIVVTGFEEPYNILFRELKQREEALTEEATFLTNEQMLIYSILGVKKDGLEKKIVREDLQRTGEKYRSVIQNFTGVLFQLDKNLLPIFIEGSQEITGYSREDFLSGNVKWEQLTEPEDLPYISKKINGFMSSPESSMELEYRIRRKDGDVRWIRIIIRKINRDSSKREKFQGSIFDITERKMIEETVKMHEDARIKEIHHRIKNNLQVISSLLDLQAETFSDLKVCDALKVVEAFRESQNRVISMALIHEELYKSRDMVTLDFSAYLQKLTADLINSYTVKRNNFNLNLNLEQVYLGMDIAIPLGIIVNELISNSLKYAFQPGQKGEIRISLCKNEGYDGVHENFEAYGTGRSESEKSLQYTLVVADNGPGIPEDVDVENTTSLGLQLIHVLVDQIEGHLELKRKRGTEFIISFNSVLSSNY
jgi:PAS domain S-box-containing protein